MSNMSNLKVVRAPVLSDLKDVNTILEVFADAGLDGGLSADKAYIEFLAGDVSYNIKSNDYVIEGQAGNSLQDALNYLFEGKEEPICKAESTIELMLDLEFGSEIEVNLAEPSVALTEVEANDDKIVEENKATLNNVVSFETRKAVVVEKSEVLTFDDLTSVAQQMNRKAEVNWIHTRKRGENDYPIMTTDNLRALFLAYGLRLRMNNMTQAWDLDSKNVLFDKAEAFSLSRKADAIADLARDLCSINGMSTNNVDSTLRSLANTDEYHPFHDWLDNLPAWDGVPRVKAVFDGVPTAKGYDRELGLKLFTKQLITHFYLKDNMYNASPDGMIVLKGGQGFGKSTFVASLYPRKEVFGVHQDGVAADLGDKDGTMLSVSAPSIEFAEFASTSSRSGNDVMKARLTQKMITFRRPYDRGISTLPNLTVFWGTINNSNFLNDPTGARRFWVIELAETLEEGRITMLKDEDRVQFWAEIKHIYKNKLEVPYLTVEEINQVNAVNRGYAMHDYTLESLMAVFGDYMDVDTSGHFKIKAGVKTERYTVKHLLEVIGADKTQNRNLVALLSAHNVKKTRSGNMDRYELPSLDPKVAHFKKVSEEAKQLGINV